MAKQTEGKVVVENPSSKRTLRVDADKYDAARKALLAVLPRTSPGLTVAEAKRKLLAHLPHRLFPGGSKAGWWLKAVQLDLEAKNIIAREDTKPLRLRRVK